MGVETRFVGRTAELGELAAALESVLAGRGAVALVAGEPGIGKTRLVAELARLAGARAVPVLWGRCTGEAGAPAYWPWRGILRSWLAAADPAEAAALLDGAADLARIAPELGGHDGGVSPARTAVEPGGVGSAGLEERFALFDLATRFFTALADGTGAVLVVDDAQWADPASLALLARLAREVRATRLLVAVTFRTAEVAADPERATVLGELAGLPWVVRMELGGLREPEIAAALADRLGTVPDPQVVATVARRTGGNPFFVGELGRLLPDGDAGDGSVPAAVRDVVARRLARLPARCQELLGAAAVLGVEVDVVLLAAVVDAPADAVLNGLRPALDDGLLERPAGRPGLRFSHDLVREAWGNRLPAPERARVHLRVVAVLEPSAEDPAVLPELARHALAAQPLGDRAAAVRWARRAADQAADRLAYEDAARLLGEAVELARGLLPPAELGVLLVEVARARARAHDVAAAVRSCTEAAELARHLDDPVLLGRAALVLPGVSEPGLLDAQRVWCEDALRGLDEADSPLRAQLLAQLAHTRAVSLDPGDADALSKSALVMAQRLDDPASLVAALRARQLARSGPAGMRERLGLGERMLDLGTRTADPDTVVWGHLWRFDALLGLGRTAEAEAELDRLEPVVARVRRPLLRLHLLRSQMAVAFGRGDWVACRRLNEEALAIGRRGGHEGVVFTAQAMAFQVAVLTGRDEPHVDVEGLRVAAARRTAYRAVMRAGLARWLLDRGMRDEAHRWYREIPASGSAGVPPFSMLIVETSRAQLAEALGHTAGAEAAYRHLAPHAELHVAGGAGATATHGSVQLYLGIAASVLGRGEPAVRHLRAAVEENERAGLTPFAALARCRLAAGAQRLGQPADVDESAALLAESAATARRLEMAPLLARSDGQGRDCGVLSRRETEIAELVARGLTNRQIATSTCISERTVDSHVQHILAKLGFSGRSQIAAWVARRTP